ncbi:hypothetical protein [Microbacterium marinilacus]|uniref:Lactococcin 972 family bacteriocin n=1 Tax=Microbacterium marinilacus TaxID=415209 RepID=A0ABP7BYH9_9MICO|nr:hypothetical protein [Microbacterium marinilacus]MBY0688098.1 hypothetical protein [Microbacterium marinilacus]
MSVTQKHGTQPRPAKWARVTLAGVFAALLTFGTTTAANAWEYPEWNNYSCGGTYMVELYSKSNGRTTHTHVSTSQGSYNHNWEHGSAFVQRWSAHIKSGYFSMAFPESQSYTIGCDV